MRNLLISPEHEDIVLRYVWRPTIRPHTTYLVRSRRKSEDWPSATIYLHRWIAAHELGLEAIKGRLIDHRDGNGQNNCWDNLRVCNALANAWNKSQEANASQFTGVDWIEKRQRWRARLTLTDGKRKFLGYFEQEIEAARAVDKAAFEEWGEVSWSQLTLPLIEGVRMETPGETFDIPF